jgi:hypothetical protein
MELGNCKLCAHPLEVLTKPVRRLSWTRHWLKGLSSLLTRPLRICPTCGAMYSGEGELLAAGAVQTEPELQLDAYRRDMAYMRDSFGGVVIASALAGAWLLLGAETANLVGAIIAGSVGAVSIVPYGFFGSRVRRARKELKTMKTERVQKQLGR